MRTKMMKFKPIKFTSSQQEVLKDIHSCDRAIEFMCRGGGKTFLIGVKLSEWCNSFRGFRIGVCTPTVLQTNMVFSETKRLNPHAVVNKTKKGLIFKHYKVNSTVEYFKEKDCGLYHAVLVDEAQSVPKETIDLIDKYAKVAIFMSVGVYDSNHMAIMAKRYSNESKMVRHTSYTAFPNDFYDSEYIEEAKRIMSNSEFRMEYEAMIVKENN